VSSRRRDGWFARARRHRSLVDLDLTFAVTDDLPVRCARGLARRVVEEFDAAHLFDLASGASRNLMGDWEGAGGVGEKGGDLCPSLHHYRAQEGVAAIDGTKFVFASTTGIFRRGATGFPIKAPVSFFMRPMRRSRRRRRLLGD
jgi:hypothetical protein